MTASIGHDENFNLHVHFGSPKDKEGPAIAPGQQVGDAKGFRASLGRDRQLAIVAVVVGREEGG